MEAFRAFVNENKTRIRPDGLIDRVRAALELDERFHLEFGAVRYFLRAQMHRWPDQVLLELMKMGNFSERVPEEKIKILDGLLKAHARAIVAGRFEEDYFSTLEDLALFFIHHKVWVIWVVGAIKRSFFQLMEELYRTRTSGGRDRMMLAATNFLVLELDQLQRVYVIYGQMNENESAELTRSSGAL